MRIAVVTPEYPPDVIGGGGLVVQSLVEEFAKRHQVRVFSAWDNHRSWVADGVQAWQGGAVISRYPLAPLSRKPYVRSVLPPNPRAVARLWRDLSSWKPTVAHLHGYGYATVDLAAFILRRRGIPYIFTAHGVPVTPGEKGRLIRLGYWGYLRAGVGRTTRFAAAVTAISRSVARSLPHIKGVEVIPNGLSPLPPSNEYRAEQLRFELKIDKDVPVIAAAGRLAKSKGFDVLLRALASLQLPGLACVLAGADGGMLRDLRELQQSVPDRFQVRFAGYLDRQGIADLYQLASVIAVPSRDEPFGLVGLEALGAGRRVVASDIGGLAEFLCEPYAELVKPDDPIALAAALTRAIGRGALGPSEAAGVQAVVSRFTWDELAPRYEKLMEASIMNHHADG